MNNETPKTQGQPRVKTSVAICGFWFHIEWGDTQTMGLDQHGNCWLNKENPEPMNKDLMNQIFDEYNNIKKQIK